MLSFLLGGRSSVIRDSSFALAKKTCEADKMTKAEDEMKRKGLAELKDQINKLKPVLDKISVDEVVKGIREDRDNSMKYPFDASDRVMSHQLSAAELVAPCGMNCGICRGYLAFTHGIPRKRGRVTYCAGCLPRAKNCYIKRNCLKLTRHEVNYCYECNEMPCKNLTHLDNRYRERYGMSMVENLKMLKAEGMDEFLKSQAEKYRCPTCGDLVCVHDGKCYGCGYKRGKV
jgi:hypothetical protein